MYVSTHAAAFPLLVEHCPTNSRPTKSSHDVGDGDADGGGDGGAADASHWVALGAGSHVSFTSRLAWQRVSYGGSSFGLYRGSPGGSEFSS